MADTFSEDNQPRSLVEKAVEVASKAGDVWVTALTEFHLGGTPNVSGIIELLKPDTAQLTSKDVKG